MMSKVVTNKQWESLALVPNDVYCGQPLSLNHHELIMISWQDRDRYPNITRGIYKYNIHLNKWNEFLKYSKDIYVKSGSHQINSLTNKLYLYTYNPNQILIFDMNKQQFEKHTIGPSAFPVFAAFVNTNHIFHSIGGSHSSKHLMWNSIKNTVTENDQLEKQFGSVSRSKAIYVPSKQMILLIGGETEPELGESIGIRKFCLKSNKWQNIKHISFDYHAVSAVLTSNEQYVIISGGYHNNENRLLNHTNVIHVLDIRNDNNYVLRKSEIVCPMSGYHYTVIMGGIKDEILVVGWIKYLFKTLIFKHLQLPPTYIVKLISQWYNQETLHWFEWGASLRKGQKHFCIDIKHI
eukprot:111874_1